MSAISCRCPKPVYRGFDTENDIRGAVVERTVRVFEEPQSEKGHQRIVESSCAVDIVTAERDVMDHLVTV